MSSPDVLQVPRPSEGASPSTSTSRSRMVHSKEMSSLSMNTLATTAQSHHLSDPLLRGGERTEQQPSQHSPRPDPSYVFGWFCSLIPFLFSSPDHRRWNIGRGPMCYACEDGVCSRAHFYQLWVSHR